ncbi:MAG: cupin domain-containing protein [Deltaproteobacteria bacterium]|nr:cupin domain-containing protein [Deltaproteobacteria bacterium]
MKKEGTYARYMAVLWVLCLMLVSWPALADDYDTGVKANVLVKSATASNGQKVAYPHTQNAEVTAMIVDIAPGRETGWHLHPVPVYAYVIAGKLAVELEDGRRYEFSNGQAIIEAVNTPHNGINIGNVPVTLIVFYTGVRGMPIVKKIEEKRSKR